MDFELFGPNGEVVRARASREGGLLVTPTYSPEIELARRGNLWASMSTAAVAGLVVRPSTVAMNTLYNNEPPGGLTYILDAAFAFNLVSTALTEESSIWLCVHPVGMTAPTNDITARSNHSGKPGVNQGHSIFDIEATVLDDGWFPWGPQLHSGIAGVTPSGAIVAPVDGKILLPPTAGISMHVVSTVVGDTFTGGFRWYEEQIAVNIG